MPGYKLRCVHSRLGSFEVLLKQAKAIGTKKSRIIHVGIIYGNI
jgi:hypothetical protein